MSVNDEDLVIRCPVTLRSPVTVESLPLLSKLDRAARRKRRGIWKRIIGRPAKQLFRAISASGRPSTGRMRIETSAGPREMEFNGRNTQFSALYLSAHVPFYEADICTVFDRLVGPTDVFYDIGANWGWHSIMLATRPKFSGTIHAFEPFPSTYADLVSVVEGAVLAKLIQCHDIALADKDGKLGMVIPDGMHSGGAQLRQQGGIEVRMAKLDSLGLPAPKAMKIDVEDHEIGVMRGGQALIEKARPFIIFENMAHRKSPETTFAPLEFLHNAGYRFYYPGWIAGHPECIVSEFAGTMEIALVPFMAAHRYMLGDLINVVAVPNERTEEFKACFK